MEMLVFGISAILIAGSVYLIHNKIQNIENKIAKANYTQKNG